MFLHTSIYLFFLLATILIYWLSPVAFRKPVLLVASYILYASFNIRFVGFLLGLTLVNFFIGQAISRNFNPRMLAWFSVLINLGVLAFFRWDNFFLESMRRAIQAFGLARLPAGLELLLPIGISFITFQAISYTTEIYRKKIRPATLVDFALYLAFFPKLLAGPLLRPDQFLGQLRSPVKKPDRNSVQAAIGLFLLGLLKKVVIADSLASLSEVAFRAAARDTGAVTFPSALYWQGFYLYSFLIYADFSGYTDLARSSATLLGFSLPENFRQPYLSESMTIFWNRWHMSMTQWFREYLFFPLSRSLLTKTGRGYARLIQTIATLSTMTLIGIWHGAAWTFVAWGLWHGVLLVLNQQANSKSEHHWRKMGSGILTFHLVGVGWVLFGSSSLVTAGRFLRGMLSFSTPQEWGIFLPPVLLCACLVFGVDLVQGGYVRLSGALQPAARSIFFIAIIVLLICLSLIYQARGGDLRPFIYGQF